MGVVKARAPPATAPSADAAKRKPCRTRERPRARARRHRARRRIDGHRALSNLCPDLNVIVGSETGVAEAAGDVGVFRHGGVGTAAGMNPCSRTGTMKGTRT
jgi:hypothetical protein